MNEPTKYSFPEIIDRVEKHEDSAKEISEQEMALVVHLGRYFDRQLVNAMRGDLRMVKKEYDEEGGIDTPKTPFALRGISSPVERAFVLANLKYFSTVHGCTGGCEWCCYDAYLTKDLEVVPPAQQRYFLQEYADVARSVNSDPEALKRYIGNFAWYTDNDPFDDPNIVGAMNDSSEIFGATPYLSTVVPRSGEENFKQISNASYRNTLLTEMEGFMKEFRVLVEEAAVLGIKKFSDIEDLIERNECARLLQSFYSVMAHSKELDPDIQRAIAQGIADQYNRALSHFGLGTVDDYIPIDSEKLCRMIAIDTSEIRSDKLSDFSLAHLKDKGEKIANGFGLKDMENLDVDEKSYAFLQGKIDEEKKKLESLPNVPEIRVSVTNSRRDLIKALNDDDQLSFDVNEGEIGNSVPSNGDRIRFSGKQFYDSGENEGKYGITCGNGVFLTPFTMFNSVAGKITHEFPQGRVFVPFKGLKEGNELSKAGQDLGDILENVIVVNEGMFLADDPPKDIRVIDGDSRLRKICFDHGTYKVTSDQVIREEVYEPADIVDYQRALWR